MSLIKVENIMNLFVFFQMFCFYIVTNRFNRTHCENINIVAVTPL